VGDQQAALFGASLEPGELSLNIATGSQASILAETPEAGNYQVRPYFDGRYLHTITHIPAGRALNGLIALLGELAARQGTPLRNPWQHINAAVDGTATTDLVADLGFFHSAYGQTGSLRHLCEENLTVGHLFRAAFAHMSDNYTRSALRLSPERRWTRIVFSGGLAQKLPSLRDMILAKLGAAHRFAGDAEDALLGLLALSQQIEKAGSHDGGRMTPEPCRS
jgi:hypothetical protein